MENNENLEDRIVDVAKDVFLENGFEMTSMSDIAAKVGINRPTLHYYFRTKERMFRAVLAPIFETFMPKVQTLLAGDIRKNSRRISDYFFGKSFFTEVCTERNTEKSR
mgnify:CR=1 FL=1